MKTNIELARLAGLKVGTNLSGVVLVGSPCGDTIAHIDSEELDRFAELVRADQREMDALICTNIATKPSNVILGVAIECAAAIRAGGSA